MELERTNHLVVTYQMLITKPAYMLESTLVELTVKSCLARFVLVSPPCLAQAAMTLFFKFDVSTGNLVGVSSWAKRWN